MIEFFYELFTVLFNNKVELPEVGIAVEVYS